MRSCVCALVLAWGICAPVHAQQEAVKDSTLSTPHIMMDGGMDTLSRRAPSVPVGQFAHVGDRADTLRNTLGTALNDSVQAVIGRGKDQGVRALRTDGRVEVGGIYGAIPYSTAGIHAMNAFGKGDIGFKLLGIPVRALFDVGTDVPVRGQRNSIRFTLDRSALEHGQRVKDAGVVAHQKAVLDSLNALKASHYREWRGALFRIDEIKATLPSTSMPSLADTSASMPTLPDTSAQVPKPPQGLRPPSERLDSLQRAAKEHEAELSRLQEVIADAEREKQRYEALFNSTKGKEGRLAGWVSGIEHLDIGTCSPASSEFLINGITFQGVSFAYAQHDVYFSFDRGRSFDDAWRSSDRVRSQLEALQRSILLGDAKDLAPRRITAVRAGFGAPESTHFHVGYLYGEREDVPLGYTGPPLDPGTTRNHVVEADLGFEVHPGHVVRAVVARSLTLPGAVTEEGEQGSIGDLFRRGNDQNTAAKLIWSSRFERSRMTLDVEGRSIAPYFESMGSGFLRRGSRAAEVRASRAFGDKWKVRGRYTMERRSFAGGGEGRMDLHRAQVQLNYKASRRITLRAMGMPMLTRTDVPGAAAIKGWNTSVSVGGDLQQQWHDLATTLTIDVGRYDWHSDGGPSGTAMNWMIGLTGRIRDHLQARVLWNTLVNASDSAAPGVANASIWLSYRADKWQVEGGVQVPTDAPWGWSLGAQRDITERLRASVQASTCSRSDLIFQEPYTVGRSRIYTCFCSLIYSW